MPASLQSGSPGNSRIIKVRAPQALSLGTEIKIGHLFGVSIDAYKEGAIAQLATEGCIEFEKDTNEKISTGETVYWDAAQGRVTRTREGNMGIGIAVVDADDPSNRVDVMLAPSTEDEAIEDLQKKVDTAKGAYFGSMAQDVPQPGNIPASDWKNLDLYTKETVSPRGCQLDTVSGQFSFNVKGAWRLDLSFSTTCDPHFEDRILYVRLWNVTKDELAGAQKSIIVTKDAIIMDFASFFASELEEQHLSDNYVFQVGGGSAITGFTWWNKGLVLNYLDSIEEASPTDPPVYPENIVGMLEARITKNEEDIADLKTRVTTLENRVGFGEAYYQGDVKSIGTINSNQWVNMDNMNAVVGKPRNINFVLNNGKFSFNVPGIWKLTVQIIGDGGWLNTIRNLGVRWLDVTAGNIVVDETRWVVMCPAINLHIATTYDVTEAVLSDEFRLQWGDPREQHGSLSDLSNMNIRVESVIAELLGDNE